MLNAYFMKLNKLVVTLAHKATVLAGESIAHASQLQSFDSFCFSFLFGVVLQHPHGLA